MLPHDGDTHISADTAAHHSYLIYIVIYSSLKHCPERETYKFAMSFALHSLPHDSRCSGAGRGSDPLL
jgi:hypothetical protein